MGAVRMTGLSAGAAPRCGGPPLAEAARASEAWLAVTRGPPRLRGWTRLPRSPAVAHRSCSTRAAARGRDTVLSAFDPHVPRLLGLARHTGPLTALLVCEVLALRRDIEGMPQRGLLGGLFAVLPPFAAFRDATPAAGTHWVCRPWRWHDDDRRRFVVGDREPGAQLLVGRQVCGAVDSQRDVDAGDYEQQSDAWFGDDVAQGVESVGSRPVGQYSVCRGRERRGAAAVGRSGRRLWQRLLQQWRVVVVCPCGGHGRDLFPVLHLDRGYDSTKTRGLLDVRRRDRGEGSPGPAAGVGIADSAGAHRGRRRSRWPAWHRRARSSLLTGNAVPNRRDRQRTLLGREQVSLRTGWGSSRCLDWELPDPAGKGIEAVRPIRDESDRRVRDLVQQLIPEQV